MNTYECTFDGSNRNIHIKEVQVATHLTCGHIHFIFILSSVEDI